MYFRVFINALFILALVVFQLGFIKGLPGWLNSVNLMLVVLVFLTSLSGFRAAFAWAVGMGLLLDIYSYIFFGAHILILAACAYLLHFLIVNFFTNRSLYAFLALIFFGFLGYEILLFSFSYLAHVLGVAGPDWNFGRNFWWHELQGVITNGALVLLVFYALNIISNTFKPVFLMSFSGKR